MYISLDPQLNPTGRSILIVSILALLLPGYFFLTLSDQTARLIFIDVCGFLYNGITAGAFAWAAYRMRQREPRLYRPWLVMTLAIFTLLITLTLWFITEVLLHQKAAPATGGSFLLGSNLLMGVGLYLIPTAKQSKAQLLRQLIDMLTVLLGSALIVWWLWINPLLPQATADFDSLVVSILYPVCGFTLFTPLISLLFQPRYLQPREPLLLIALAVLFMVAANLWFAQQATTGSYESGKLGDYLWLMALVFAGMGAALQGTAFKQEEPTAQSTILQRRVIYSIRVLLPPLTLLVTYAVMIFAHNHDHNFTYLLMAGGVALLFVLVSARQLLTVIENFNLAVALHTELHKRQAAQAALQHTNELLEERVVARTQELALVNEQLRQNEQQLRFDAFHDKLTGLPNRAQFIEHLEQALQLTQTDPTYTFAVLFLDFDGFKVVNDSLGHGLGDELLVALAHRLQVCVPAGNLVARLGGDEFVILLARMAKAMPLVVAEHLQRELRQPFEIRGYRLFTSASIGVVLNDGAHTTAGDVLRDADIAMYRAKATGKARCVVFDATMRVEAAARLGLETELRHALLHHELRLAYQPIWDLGEHRLIGFEALARWPHPTRGFITPGDFIPLAEETGLILPLGEWVLEEACRQLKEWHQQWPQRVPLTISVNISARQLYQIDLPALVAQILQKVELPATCLKLEITESVYMEDVAAATAAFVGLHALGVQLQIDDFGTGYSSFSYLHRLPIHTLKIDQTFVKHINTDERHSEIVRAIATLAHNLHLNVIAEGVETQEQLAHVKWLGCEQAQGYVISKPLDSLAAERFIHSSWAANGAGSREPGPLLKVENRVCFPIQQLAS